MNDALEILLELDMILFQTNPESLKEVLENYVNQKRLEFVEPQGDCCG